MRRVCVLCLLGLVCLGCSLRSAPTAGLTVAGSTSVQPVAEVLAEAYAAQGGDRVRVQGGGSTAGVQAVLSGVAQVGAVSRNLTPAETSRGLIAHRIGYDVLAVVVHPNNPVAGLSREQLRRVYAGAVRDWREVGGRPGLIHLVSREAGSGSREAFLSLVGPVSPRAIIQPSSGAIRVAVMDDEAAIGYVSLGVARMGGLRMLPVDRIAPGAQGYPLIRPLGFVTAGVPQVRAGAFIRFALAPTGQRLVAEEGLVPVVDTGAD